MDGSIVLLNSYEERDELLIETIRQQFSDCRILVLEDQPFLPAGVQSVYDWWIEQFEVAERKIKDVYYAFVTMPKFWEVRAMGINGAIYDMGEKKADIFFREPIERRLVQRVEWYDRAGSIYRKDYYDRYGNVYRTDWTEQGKVSIKSYYTSAHQEVICANQSNQVITFRDREFLPISFGDEDAMMLKMMERAITGKRRVILTSNRQAEWMKQLHRDYEQQLWMVLQKEEDVRRCREQKYHQQLQCPLIIMNNRDTENCEAEETQGEYQICYGAGATGKSTEKSSRQVLIMTASDRIPGIEEITGRLTDFQFSIAANTIVSPKLQELGKRENVHIYPQVTVEQQDRLWNQCEFYLDINYGQEIYNAVEKASVKGMLLLGYRTTLHGKPYVAEELIYEESAVEELIQMLQRLGTEEKLRRQYQKQQAEKQNKNLRKVFGE